MIDSGKGKKKYFLEAEGQIPYDFSIALELNNKTKLNNDCYTDGGYAYFPLDKEILAKFDSEEKLQEQFNKNVEEVISKI